VPSDWQKQGDEVQTWRTTGGEGFKKSWRRWRDQLSDEPAMRKIEDKRPYPFLVRHEEPYMRNTNIDPIHLGVNKKAAVSCAAIPTE